ncbi:hypothetical protein JANAI62_08230 [Jannaschia pagri]|uniref:Uncharacterized protein n=1 Tax=Jannaschia pagri TaxID=2829797 RepID=A0ABQ4NJ04_9RHOB|nr:hypothetical protein [Jannaschia sp. AI_61]GIT89692.1 hypothetical protein JANAI61_01500 [Jannaschia sp. AI_61]GIT94200.1 hypothetical protein JANAI62_08230 [Jannaschia sp. AI_62]
MRGDLKRISGSIDQLLDRIVDTASPTVATALEKRIEALEDQKRLLAEKVANSAQPRHTFEGMFERAFEFLANPWKLWASEQYPHRQTVLKNGLRRGSDLRPRKGSSNP